MFKLLKVEIQHLYVLAILMNGFPFSFSDLLMFTALVFPSTAVIQLNWGSDALHESSDKIKGRGEVSTDFLLKLANQSWN